MALSACPKTDIHKYTEVSHLFILLFCAQKYTTQVYYTSFFSNYLSPKNNYFLEYVTWVNYQYSSAIKKEQTTNTCNNMDGSQSHYAE